MFANPWHILDDMESNDNDKNEHLEVDGIMSMEQSDLPMGAIIRSSDTINSSTPMERALAKKGCDILWTCHLTHENIGI